MHYLINRIHYQTLGDAPEAELWRFENKQNSLVPKSNCQSRKEGSVEGRRGRGIVPNVRNDVAILLIKFYYLLVGFIIDSFASPIEYHHRPRPNDEEEPFR